MLSSPLARGVAAAALLVVAALPALAQAPRPSTGSSGAGVRQAGRSARMTTAKEELLELESRWNVAHVYGDTTTLYKLWADDIIVIVPEMRPFSKEDLKAFWRSGRSNITRHETSDVTVRGYDNTAVVEGRLTREDSFGALPRISEWRFTKIYVKRDGEWKVVSYHASPLPSAR